jgi:hypothetical protein
MVHLPKLVPTMKDGGKSKISGAEGTINDGRVLKYLKGYYLKGHNLGPKLAEEVRSKKETDR